MKGTVIEIAKFVLLVGVFFFIITNLIQAFKIERQSMDPALAEGQIVLVWRMPYLGPFGFLGGPGKGDMVVFKEPGGTRAFVKRVVGLPGETVEVRSQRMYVEDTFFDETYLPGRLRTADFAPTKSGKDQFFLIGDNRSVSLDSRAFGPVDRSAMVGVLFFSVWPFDRLGTFEVPKTAP